MASLNIYLVLSGILFALGAVGVSIRRNPLVMFMCIELMLNAANLAFATFSQIHATGTHRLGGPADGPVFVFLVMTIAAAEAVVGLAIIIAIFRSREGVDSEDLQSLRG